ncbi:MAG: nucleotide 5'-monophosphate nucleosidase PpnN [Pseudomonadales bacterium]|nr:nucleotide 5'-monophosphate nucleosidase PpnN [Pseudomonadales bacterium]
MDAQVSPRGAMELLSQREVHQLSQTQDSSMLTLFRQCALAVLNTGNETDDASAIFRRYADFNIKIVQRTRGVKLEIKDAPDNAFVNDRMIEGIRQHLFAVLRDILYNSVEIENNSLYSSGSSENITEGVFHVLKNALALRPERVPNIVVCWGGHSISRHEYEYTKEVGYHLGLLGLDICTGCGSGAMKGPMKGAAIGHAKQRNREARYIGLSEPSIIAAEPPNPMVSNLIILPDIEKRLEAFVRVGHGVIVFPGGVGTVEEILYLLGVLMSPANENISVPMLLTGPESSRKYFGQIDELVCLTLGEQARDKYKMIIGDPVASAEWMSVQISQVLRERRKDGNAYYFNWLLNIPMEFQLPFAVSHESVSQLVLSRDLPSHDLALNLRKAFSAIVTGNIKEEGIQRVNEHGPFEIRADKSIMVLLDGLLQSFVQENRMKLPGSTYHPCYKVVAGA